MNTPITPWLKLAIPFVLPALLAAVSLHATEPFETRKPTRELQTQLLEVNPNWSERMPDQSALASLRSVDDEVALIQTHFRLVLDQLMAANVDDLTESQSEERARNIERLREYTLAGVFPQNVFVAGRRPVFIDPWGTHCAVGHLIATSGHPQLARLIDREHRLDVLGRIETDGLTEWQLASGLRVQELALIQPHYEFRNNSQTIQYPTEVESLILGDSAEILEALKSGKLTVNNRCGGKTLLHFAAASGDLELVKHLVDLGADLHAVSTRGCDESEIAKGGRYKRFEVRWNASTEVTPGKRYADGGRVYETVQGSFVADVLQDFFGGMVGKNALHYATAEPRMAKLGHSKHLYYSNGFQHRIGNRDASTNPLDSLKEGRAAVATWLQEQGLSEGGLE
ncbi:hypothetical protein RISK_002145 [Rhodopirellula islandica]|uniref:Uncharacterized protein n=1 Tax=Rhodopirellula islandica TaxID=595434 RepID=A0A0J1BG46_RHOIS|nr:ankyrin repeat domain-containing protein [Rhodopirellula islandica]KLU05513.1 hypothetical protein RISK_002145 [Rhodopirellula islandica]